MSNARRLGGLLLPLLACTSGDLEESAGRGPVGRPLEECTSPDCTTQDAPAMSELVRDTVEATRRDDRSQADRGGLPERPSLMRRSMSGVDASEDVGALDKELDSLPPGAPEAPSVLLRLSIAQHDSGDDAGMKESMLRLIREHPMSELVPHVYLLLADHYRQQGDLDAAIKLYDKAAQFHDSRIAALAHYSLAWCRLELSPADATRALESFVKAIHQAPVGLATEHDGFEASELIDAALRDLGTAYFEVGKPSKFVPFFVRLVPDDAEGRTTEVVTRLGTAYENAGQTADAVELCNALTSRWADAACSWQ